LAKSDGKAGQSLLNVEAYHDSRNDKKGQDLVLESYQRGTPMGVASFCYIHIFNQKNKEEKVEYFNCPW
jgi:hypothetical protein